MNYWNKALLLFLLISIPFGNIICQTNSSSNRILSGEISGNKKDENKSGIAGEKTRSLYIGFVTGVTFNKYQVTNKYQRFESFSEPSPYAGISLTLINNNSGFGILLQSTIDYKTFNYSYLTENQTTSNYHETSLKSLSSTSGIGIIFTPVSGKLLKPFIEGGALLNIFLNPEYENYINEVHSRDNVIFSFYNHDVLNSAFSYGAFLKSGIMLNMKNGNTFKLTGGYDFLMGSGNVRVHSFDLSITYMIKFK
jgi:hypothetical protein